MSKKPLRVLAMSDTHCGHNLGLTPPEWDKSEKVEHYRMRRAMWDWWKQTAPAKPDILILNGDAIDGKGLATGGSEQMYIDWDDQVDIAADIINQLKPGAVYMTHGTGYHTGKDKDYENDVAKAVNAVRIGGEDDLDIRGTVFNYKHHVGRSGIPHGRATAVLRDSLWNMIWAERGEYPRADVIIRSHVHYHVYAGDCDILAMTLPSLQGYGTKYGGRRMTGTVDIGFVMFDVYDSRYEWKSHTWRAPFKAPEKVE